MDALYRQYLLDGQKAASRYAMASPRTIQRGLVGPHLANRAGSSLEFMDHREYIPGDDLRRIDWAAFARSDKLAIKMFRDEVNPHVDIILDCSRSMSLKGTPKARGTLALAALLAQAAANCDYTFVAWRAGVTCERVFNGADNPALWDGIEFSSTVSCEESFRVRAPAWRPRGIRILISDLLWLASPHSALAMLSDKASAVFIIQLLADCDVNPPEPGNVRLLDSETGLTHDIFIDAAVGDGYRRDMANHQSNWNRACRRFGAVMATLVAENIFGESGRGAWKLDELVLAQILKVT